MGEFDGLKDRLTDGCRYKTVFPPFKKKQERKGGKSKSLLGTDLHWFVYNAKQYPSKTHVRTLVALSVRQRYRMHLVLRNAFAIKIKWRSILASWKASGGSCSKEVSLTIFLNNCEWLNNVIMRIVNTVIGSLKIKRILAIPITRNLKFCTCMIKYILGY